VPLKAPPLFFGGPLPSYENGYLRHRADRSRARLPRWSCGNFESSRLSRFWREDAHRRLRPQEFSSGAGSVSAHVLAPPAAEALSLVVGRCAYKRQVVTLWQRDLICIKDEPVKSFFISIPEGER